MGIIAPARAVERVVGVADLKVSNTAGERIITYALGSCLGIVIHDPVVGVAGMLHVMLPTGTIDPVKMQDKPAMFVDSGVPMLFKECYKLGAKKERMQVKVAGGAHAGACEEDDRFQIGKRNMIALRKLLWKNGVMVHAHDTGGVQTSRTMWVDVTSGEVTLKINGTESKL
ncbi:chemotaxis protein CheD [Gemmatimonas aurantiaca T-27]|uniref:Probable chemoreceptor glutamine deamidase CheD n=1 Tax=Gemmatimonas aurantiaca (strain DSM 14586 / JCM 11422 / NBRC 100505 / T-27) TaxID=379066 RepID=C1A595_GEMAT|nr:chemotaxis protein CheD [Gemmatimonas aurantiaca]BAH37405.1 chemotaxis protein CheD [Gemmatimonas aurantiaca T-27]